MSYIIMRLVFMLYAPLIALLVACLTGCLPACLLTWLSVCHLSKCVYACLYLTICMVCQCGNMHDSMLASITVVNTCMCQSVLIDRIAGLICHFSWQCLAFVLMNGTNHSVNQIYEQIHVFHFKFVKMKARDNRII